MCLFTPIVPCKPTHAPSILRPKPETMTNFEFYKALIFWSNPLWTMPLTFLLVPQACSSPALSSCPPDPAASLYSKKTLDENPCYARCLTSSCTIVFSMLLVFSVIVLILVMKAARSDPPGKKNKSDQCV